MVSHSTRSRAWFPGRMFALTNLTGVEVFDPRRIGQVHISKTTLHGTPAQLRHVAQQLLNAAQLAESSS
ncbi:hypothetical protein KGQ20_39270 [Catenulispora sp. NF23]|uniref:hypothetical protein n=1 Tax=Catenulispora pinistramenti TaxID=2705254 RepID=UPI001BACC2A4|nr:hypothetical protein [Catenulispora pinistramenti]MBS2538805.1 hypothetical protein [Catenulispora pinistramenti]